MSLKKLLKNFCIDAYQELIDMGELPRPPYSSPLIAGNPLLIHRQSQLTMLASHIQLQEYMRSSGLSDRLHDIGHTWLWHEEVFEWLFLERVLAESKGVSLDTRVFNLIFRRALAEISRSSFRIRRITVLNGLPKLRTTIKLSKDTILTPIDFSSHHYILSETLGWRFQDRNRAPSFWIGPDDCLLIQDFIISKGNKGEELLKYRRQAKNQTEVVIKALKLSLDTPIYPKAVYSSYLSCFPLLPISHTEFEEFREFSISVETCITKAESQRIRKNFDFIHSRQSQIASESGFFGTALDRFADSFRFKRLEQSIVDLIVALEAMLNVSQEELKRRLATYASFLLGTNNSERQTLYQYISAGYKLRNAIVHGSDNQRKGMINALKEFFPELKGKPDDKVIPYLAKAVEELQKAVRLILRAYIYMKSHDTRNKWPDTNELDPLPFDSKKRRIIQKQLGIGRKPIGQKPTKRGDITHWRSIG